MQAYDDEGKNPHGQGDSFDQRDARALTEYHSVLAKGGGIYEVVSQSGKSYAVDSIEGVCQCKDFKYNLPTDEGRERCKHYARVMFATGEWSIPSWVNPTAVDPNLGEHVESSPTVALTDGGSTAVSGDEPLGSDDESGDDDCDCDGLPDDAVCWPCFRDGEQFGD